MATSMNNRRQPENNPREKQQGWGRKPPQRTRSPLKQPPKPEVRRRLPQPPDQPSRPKSIVKPKAKRKIEPQPSSPTLPQPRQLPSAAQIKPTRANFRATPPVPLPPSSKASRRRNRFSIFGKQLSPPVKPSRDVQKRRREYNKSKITLPEIVTSPRRKTIAPPVKQRPQPPSVQLQRNRRSRRPLKRPVSSLVYIIRMVIVGIGIGAIAGTLLSALNPSEHTSVKANNTTQTEIQENSTQGNSSLALNLRQEIPTLKAQMQTLVAQHPNLEPGVFIIDLDTGAYLDWQGSAIFPAASTIKVPILVAFFQDVDAGKIRLDEPLILQQNLIAAGSGDLQYQQPGSQYTALDVATKMITISDNTATNMIIARLGGPNALNQRFASWGLRATAIRNPLPDLEGTNTSSPRDMANLMSVVNQGKLMSLRSRDRLLDIMKQTQTNTMLPQGLGAGATIAHKTGNIGSLLADVGLVDMPTGKRYIVVAMVKRPHNDDSAQDLIRQISSITYEYLNQPRATPSTTSMPSQNTATLTKILTSESPVY